jgi:glutaredoxin
MSKQAVLYRMVSDQHICPYGLRSKDLLQRQGFTVEDHLPKSRAETDEFKQQHHVKTTPQTFIENIRIGGYDDLRRYFGKGKAGQHGTSYTPVIAIFAVAAFFALAMQFS